MKRTATNFLRSLPPGLLAFCLAFGALLSCTKKTEDPKASPAAATLATLKAQYAPYELVTIKAPKNALGAQILAATINGKAVQLLARDTLASFLLPDLATGRFDLTFTASGQAYQVPVAVAALPAIQSPDGYFSALEADITRSIARLTAQVDALLKAGGSVADTQPLQDNAQQYAALLSTYKATYQGLSAADKQEFSRALAANKPMSDEYSALTSAFGSSAADVQRIQGVQNHEQAIEISMKAYTLTVLYTVAHIPAILVGGSLAAAAGFNPGVLLALGVVTTSFMVNVCVVHAATGILLNKSLKPYEGLSIDQTAYTIKQEVQVSITAKYRSLFQGDETSGAGGSILNKGLDAYKTLRQGVSDLIANLPPVLRPKAMKEVLRAAFSSVGRVVHSSYLSIKNISNPAVTLTQLNQADGTVKVVATTTATTDQSFTYDLSYTNSGFSPGLTKQVSARVVVATYNYGLQIGDYNTNYDLIRVQATLVNGQAVTLPNYMTQMVRLTLDGVPVKTGPYNLPWHQVAFGTAPVSGAASTNATYPVTLYDATNQRSATVSLNVTLTNQAYTRIAGQTITCDYQRNGRSVLGAITIRFATEGTYTKTYADGSNAGGGKYSFVSTIAPSHELCSTYTITKGKVGCIYLPSESSNVFIPDYMYVYEDGTLGANSFYGCTDRGENWVIQ